MAKSGCPGSSSGQSNGLLSRVLWVRVPPGALCIGSGTIQVASPQYMGDAHFNPHTLSLTAILRQSTEHKNTRQITSVYVSNGCPLK